jgi:hypothetical protein
VEVAVVEERDADPWVAQPPGSVQATEAATDDDDAMDPWGR